MVRHRKRSRGSRKEKAGDNSSWKFRAGQADWTRSLPRRKDVSRCWQPLHYRGCDLQSRAYRGGCTTARILAANSISFPFRVALYTVAAAAENATFLEDSCSRNETWNRKLGKRTEKVSILIKEKRRNEERARFYYWHALNDTGAIDD